ncbi:MAG: hypothetical protein U9N48_07945 [Euryarchaeota archaeon]|nr:hypothetical protein [Euryarchaeota archaeon]
MYDAAKVARILQTEKLSASTGSNPAPKSADQGVGDIEARAPFGPDDGRGKTTLLGAIAGVPRHFAVDGGRIHSRAKI